MSNRPTPGARLRQAVAEERPLQVAGAINAYHARLAEAVGFKALYLSGGGVAAGSCGIPDLGITTMEDVLTDLRRITDVTELPLLVDIDTGWGGAFNIARAVRSANNGFRNRPVVLETHALDAPAIEGRLSDLQPLRIQPVEGAEDTRLFRGLLQQHHYLGYTGPVGENLQYLIGDCQGRLLGCMLYGAAAWRVAGRDRFIGWDEAARKRGLSRIANNMRFLIPRMTKNRIMTIPTTRTTPIKMEETAPMENPPNRVNARRS